MTLPRKLSRSSKRSAKHPRVIGWGEMGLDYHYDHVAPDLQKRVFRRQLDQAEAAKLPIIIHCRDAWPDCLEIMEQDWRLERAGRDFSLLQRHARTRRVAAWTWVF